MTRNTDDSTPARDRLDVIIVGAGQAGLAMAWHLRQRGVRFLIVDSAPQVGHSWQTRWDSLRLFTSAQYDSLPGMLFPAPSGTYPTKDDVAAYLTAYAARFELPILLNRVVHRLQHGHGGFEVHTSQGTLRAGQVVVATGPFQRPAIPAFARDLASSVPQLHSAQYRNPEQLPQGLTLVVGAGNTGMQIAAELAKHGAVTLSVGARPPRLPQRLLGRDIS